MPPRSKSPSSPPVVEPEVAELRRASAPTRTAFAPAADCTSAGLMMSGSSTERIRSLDMQAVASIASIATAAEREEISVFISTVILEAEVESERDIARRSERLERGRCVASGAVGFWIDTGVLGPEDPEIAHGAG